jgi:hypothetical protein
MAIELSDWQVKTFLADPLQFYAAITSRKRYVPKADLVDGDNELMTSDLCYRGCAVLVCMAHRTHQAFLMMIRNEDLTALQEGLKRLQFDMNSAALFRPSSMGLPW